LYQLGEFQAYCRRSLADIQGQGRYREFTALQKQADRFPYYRRADGKPATALVMRRDLK